MSVVFTFELVMILVLVRYCLFIIMYRDLELIKACFIYELVEKAVN